jgi:hypothetical protein
MSYEKQNFVDGQILTADNLNHIEDGIEKLNQELYHDARVINNLEVIWDGQINDQEVTEEYVINNIQYTFVKIADFEIDDAKMCNADMKIDINVFGNHTDSIVNKSGAFVNNACVIKSDKYNLVLVTQDNTDVTMDGVTVNFSKGIWFTKCYDSSHPYAKESFTRVSNLEIVSGYVKLVDTIFTENKPGLVIYDENGIALGEIFNSKTNTATGECSHAEGWMCNATGECSHAEGWKCNATGKYSHAEGSASRAEGDNSHAEGISTVAASATYGHAEGYGSKAVGEISHAEGYTTEANGKYSHSEGHNSISSGTSSHAEGENSKANGNYSHAEGYYTIASSNYQHVQGKLNVEDTENKYAHIIGNGTSGSARSNAHTIDWNGNAWFAGNVSINGTPANDNDLVNKRYVDVLADNLNHIENGIEQLDLNKSDKLVYSDEASYTFNINELEIIEKKKNVYSYSVKGLIRVIPNKSINASIAKKDGSIESLSTITVVEETIPPSVGLTNIIVAASEDYSKFFQIITNARVTKDNDLIYDSSNNVIVINHPDIDNIESFTVTMSGEFNIDDEKIFDDRYQLVNKFEKDYWDNKADKSELFSGDYNDLATKQYVDENQLGYDTREYTNINISYWNGQIGERENVVLGNYTFVKMDDLSNCPDNVNHCEYYGYCRLHTDGSAGIPILYNSMQNHSDINDYYLCKHDSGAYLCAIVIKDSVVLINDLSINLTKGLWFIQTINPNLEGTGIPEHILKTVTKTDLEEFELTLISGELKLIDSEILGNKPGLVIRNEKGDALGEIFNDETNIASEPFSHAEGCGTQATARVAHVEGFYTKASGFASHAEGYYTEAASEYQHVQGQYNIKDTENKYAHIVGNGAYNKPSNAHTLDWNGNAWFAGNVSINGTPVNDNDLVNKQYVDALLVNINEKLNDNIKWSSQKQTSVDDATDLESAIVLINNLKAILKAYGLID